MTAYDIILVCLVVVEAVALLFLISKLIKKFKPFGGGSAGKW